MDAITSFFSYSPCQTVGTLACTVSAAKIGAVAGVALGACSAVAGYMIELEPNRREFVILSAELCAISAIFFGVTTGGLVFVNQLL